MAIDLTGKKFGKLTVLNRSSINHKTKQAYWNCLCSCGEMRAVASQSLRSGKSKNCLTCGRPMSRVIGVASNALLSQYRNGATKRGIEFKLTPVEFKSLIFKNCFYCGIEPLQKLVQPHEILYYNGIDRVINSTGYVLDNCVPCCKICNISKRSMSKDDFLAWIKRAYEFNYAKHN